MTTPEDKTQPILSLRGISKSFPGVRALTNIDLDIYPAEVHSLVGENGAGKSTLMKIIQGIHQKDEGKIIYRSEDININSPSEAIKLGISMIHQELNSIPEMSISDNIFIGRELSLMTDFFFNKQEQLRQSQALLDKFSLPYKASEKIKHLSVAHRQMIEIIKAVFQQAKVIIMDEPTSSLSEEESQQLFKIIAELKAAGVAIIYISHRLEEVLELSDRVSILRDGEYVGTRTAKNLTRDELVNMMVGRTISQLFPKRQVAIGEPIFEVKNLCRTGVFSDISFSVRAGEILGIAGLVGAGRSEIVQSIFGLDPLTSGTILLNGKELKIRHPQDAIQHNIAFASEDRKGIGLVMGRSIRENISLPHLADFTRHYFLDQHYEKEETRRISERLKVKTPSINQKVENLSGGNQQKVVLSKGLLKEPTLLIIDEPTRGIDIGAKSEIHSIMCDLAEKGMGIIMISSEMPEILGMSDRIIVIGGGRIKGEFTNANITQEDILHCAI